MTEKPKSDNWTTIKPTKEQHQTIIEMFNEVNKLDFLLNKDFNELSDVNKLTTYLSQKLKLDFFVSVLECFFDPNTTEEEKQTQFRSLWTLYIVNSEKTHNDYYDDPSDQIHYFRCGNQYDFDKLKERSEKSFDTKDFTTKTLDPIKSIKSNWIRREDYLKEENLKIENGIRKEFRLKDDEEISDELVDKFFVLNPHIEDVRYV